VGSVTAHDDPDTDERGWLVTERSGGAGGTTWGELTEAVVRELADWQAAHPGATCAELEASVEQQIAALREHLMAEAAVRAASLAVVEEAPACAWCAAPLAARDTPARTLRLRGNAQVRLTRAYLTCTACGYGVFPPG